MTPTQGETPKICKYTLTGHIYILFVVTWTGIIGENGPKTTCCPVLQENRHVMEAWGAGTGLRSADPLEVGQTVLPLKNTCTRVVFCLLCRFQPAKLHSCAETERGVCGLILSYI